MFYLKLKEKHLGLQGKYRKKLYININVPYNQLVTILVIIIRQVQVQANFSAKYLHITYVFLLFGGYMRMAVVPVVVGTIGKVFKSLKRDLEELEILKAWREA